MPDSRLHRHVVGALKKGLHSALDWFYPRHCYHCGRSLRDANLRILCRRCVQELSARRIGREVCACCGLPLTAEPSPQTLCVTCRTKHWRFDLARAFVPYAGPAASVIKSFKFEGDFFLGPMFLRGLLKLGWAPPEVGDVDAVIPVPLHPRRRRERGYDQALLLAQVMAEHLGCPLMRRALVRTRYTSQQSLLPVSRRWDNVRGAFAVKKPQLVRGRRPLLVDDVMTTGVTADECAKPLKEAGAEQVKVLTLARTVP